MTEEDIGMDTGASVPDQALVASDEARSDLHPPGFDPSRGDLPKRVLVCGGRKFNNFRFVWRTLDSLNRDHNVEAIIHGGARGADEWARMWAHQLANMGDGPHPRAVAYPANWKKHGKGAGPIRNQQMLNEAEPDLVVAFPGGRGTADMVRRAEKAGLCVMDLRDSDGTATAAANGDLPVPKDCQARAGTASPNSNRHTPEPKQ